MTDIWQTSLYDPLYQSPIAVNAEFESASGTTAVMRITDETKGTPISGGPGVVETVRPTCRVRAAELVAKGITASDLPDSTITFNGRTWRVKASRMVPSPMGEDAGEVMLILLNDGG